MHFGLCRIFGWAHELCAQLGSDTEAGISLCCVIADVHIRYVCSVCRDRRCLYMFYGTLRSSGSPVRQTGNTVEVASASGVCQPVSIAASRLFRVDSIVYLRECLLSWRDCRVNQPIMPQMVSHRTERKRERERERGEAFPLLLYDVLPRYLLVCRPRPCSRPKARQSIRTNRK